MIDLGSVYQVAVDVMDAAGVLTDPATATLTLTLPDGTTVSPPVPLPSTVAGKVRVDYPTVQPGRHLWRLTTTGPVTAYADIFDVSPAALPGLFSLAAARKQLNMNDPANTSDDDEVRFYIGATTGAVEKAKGETIARRTVTERLWADGGQIVLSQAPVLSLTSVESVDGTHSWSTSPTVLDVDPPSGLITVLSGTALSGWLKVTYVAGYQLVPDEYRLAGLIILQHLWETQRGAMGVKLGGDGEAYMPGRGFAIPHRAAELLGLTLPGIA